MTKNCVKELGEEYVKVYEFDAKSSKATIWMNVAALAISLVIFLPCFFTVFSFDRLDYDAWYVPLICMFVTLIALIVYMILHELLHGLVYKIATREKLTFGLTLTIAYCGVPDVYVNRKWSLIACAAPLTVFGIIFTLATVLVTIFVSPAYGIFVLVITALHFGGCVGDIYGIIILLFRRNIEYVKDTGTKQEFYARKAADGE